MCLFPKTMVFSFDIRPSIRHMKLNMEYRSNFKNFTIYHLYNPNELKIVSLNSLHENKRKRQYMSRQKGQIISAFAQQQR